MKPRADTSRPRVLLIAEAANPEWVSVPLEGWSHSQAIIRQVNGHLVTQVRNREAILRTGLVEGEAFTAIDSEKVANLIWKAAQVLRGGAGKGWTVVTALGSLSYYYFESLVWERFGKALSRGEFDLVHRLTPLSPTTPSLLAKKCRDVGVPFVLGPLNGGVPWPKGFDGARRQEREWLSYARAAHKLLPGSRSTFKNASAVIAGSLDTLAQVPVAWRAKTFYVPENAIEPGRFEARRTRTATLPVRVIFVGRLVPYKGADMLIEAAAPLARSGRLVIEIIGDGPQRAHLHDLVDRLGLKDTVRLPGWVEHQQLQHRLAESDVLAFPSVREFGGAVVLEAMAVGVTPVVMDYGGPGELVTERTGVRVPMGTREEIIGRFRSVLSELAAHPERIDELGAAAMQRARQQFTWDAKAAAVVEVYDWLLGRAPRPTLPAPTPDFQRAGPCATEGAGASHEPAVLAKV